MKVTLTAVFENDEKDDEAVVWSYLRSVNMDRSSGDADGRRWIQLNGDVTPEKLIEFIELLKNSN
jgi:hypothetical protein